ncbi:MAG TPA: type II toxin-antitoxin system prevent-host-death family antitoxin [Bryobacterales bacterium]|nr:type II toxin-antitoxin system prevent-host-death family antitoxin [Bryobacterales bacterium]
MTDHIGLSTARTHLSALMERTQLGERITITKRGVPVAMLVPVSEDATIDAAKAARRLRKIRESVSLGGVTIGELRDEGRRR